MHASLHGSHTCQHITHQLQCAVGTLGCKPLAAIHIPHGLLQIRAEHTGWGSQLAPIKLHAFLLTVKHQGTLSPMLFHKLIGGAEYPAPKKPTSQGKGAAHRNLENLKGVRCVRAVFKVRTHLQFSLCNSA
jgi:hypothetical protein